MIAADAPPRSDGDAAYGRNKAHAHAVDHHPGDQSALWTRNPSDHLDASIVKDSGNGVQHRWPRRSTAGKRGPTFFEEFVAPSKEYFKLLTKDVGDAEIYAALVESTDGDEQAREDDDDDDDDDGPDPEESDDDYVPQEEDGEEEDESEEEEEGEEEEESGEEDEESEEEEDDLIADTDDEEEDEEAVADGVRPPKKQKTV